MYQRIDLQLLRARLREFEETSFFSPAVKVNIDKLARVADAIDSKFENYPPVFLSHACEAIWFACRFLSGSSTKHTPYEIIYCLKKAAADWIDEKILIHTALLDEKSYYFHSFDPWTFFKNTMEELDFSDMSIIFVNVALPELYKSRPLYLTPLYHELGHFVDGYYSISRHAELILRRSGETSITQSHLAEFFADLFSACYCGQAAIDTLEAVAGDHTASPTHPSTVDRCENIRQMLAGEECPLLSMYNHLLEMRKLPLLHCRFELVNLNNDFDNLLPIEIKSDAQLHGILPSGVEYLNTAILGQSAPWSKMGIGQSERITNDLIQKSIRSRAIEERWRE